MNWYSVKLKSAKIKKSFEKKKSLLKKNTSTRRSRRRRSRSWDRKRKTKEAAQYDSNNCLKNKTINSRVWNRVEQKYSLIASRWSNSGQIVEKEPKESAKQHEARREFWEEKKTKTFKSCLCYFTAHWSVVLNRFSFIVFERKQ